MNTNHVKAEIAEARVEAGMGNKQAKGAMGKIRQHAKAHGDKAFTKMIQDLDTVTDRSREWNEAQRDLFWRSALEEIQTRLEKELR